MRIHSRFVLALLSILAATQTAALASPVRVLVTVPDLAFAAKAIGADRLQVDSFLSGLENPHFVDARPDLIRKAASAQVLFAVGLDLEIGWLPKVLQKASNPEILPGAAGYTEVGGAITVLQKPQGLVDRSMGDLHPQGNPHFWLSPLALATAGMRMAATLSAIDPEGKAAYEKGALALKVRMEKLVAESRQKLKRFETRLKVETPVIEYHQEFAYLWDLLGMKSFGSIEEKPGVPPSANRLGNVAEASKKAGVKFAVSAPYAPLSLIHKYSELSGIPHVILPTSSKRDDGFDYEKIHRSLVDALVQGLDGKLAHPN